MCFMKPVSPSVGNRYEPCCCPRQHKGAHFSRKIDLGRFWARVRLTPIVKQTRPQHPEKTQTLTRQMFQARAIDWSNPFNCYVKRKTQHTTRRRNKIRVQHFARTHHRLHCSLDYYISRIARKLLVYSEIVTHFQSIH